MVIVTLRKKTLNLFNRCVSEKVCADEVHISSNGCLVLKSAGTGVATYAGGEWLSAKVGG